MWDKQLQNFRDALDLCAEKLPGGTAQINGECLKEVVGGDPEAAARIVEYYLEGAADEPQLLFFATMIASAYDSCFSDDSLVEAVRKKAKEI